MAIAFDAATDGGFTASSSTHTFSHTCTGSDLGIFVLTFSESSLVHSYDITGITYNSVAMSEVFHQAVLGDRWMSVWELTGPATGANNVVITSSIVASAIGGVAASYTGVNQATMVDSSNSGTASSAGGITVSTTVIASNCWTVMGVRNNVGAASAGAAPSTLRIGATDGLAWLDSNGTVGTGSQSLEATGTTADWAAIIISIQPPTGTTPFDWMQNAPVRPAHYSKLSMLDSGPRPGRGI